MRDHAEVLKTAGYHTLMVGKWHLCHIYFDGKKQLDFETNEPFWENKADWPMQRGFEEYYGTIHGVCSYYDPFSLIQSNQVVKPGQKDFYYTDAIRSNRYEKELDRGVIEKGWQLSPRDPRVPPWGEIQKKEWQANRMATFGHGRASGSWHRAIVAELKAKGIETNTLVIFLSDNGACDEIIHPFYYGAWQNAR